MSVYNDLAQVSNAEKHGKKMVMCIDCVRWHKGNCKRRGYKTGATESCIFGKKELRTE